MFRVLGNTVVRYWQIILVCWVVAVAGISYVAPEWSSVVMNGEFAFLPADSPSLQGEKLFKRAFPDDLLASSIVIVVRREHGDQGLRPQDLKFIEDTLKPQLEDIVEEQGGYATESKEHGVESNKSNISRIRTYTDKSIGDLLQSEDNKASLVIVELSTEFLDQSNAKTVESIENLLKKDEFKKSIEPGLDITLSGIATVGRDMIRAANQSAEATELWTVLLVILLLIIIYRAPILALIPLFTVFVSVKIALSVLAILGSWGWVGLFSGIEIYVTVILYGAGVDYCLFLIARHREELDKECTFKEAISNSIATVGAALAASAGTTMCGIGMMVFAEFGKFQQAGIAMALSLFFVLIASLTLSPALLCLAGRFAYWPQSFNERVAISAGWLTPSSVMARLMQRNWAGSLWESVSLALLKKPGKIWLSTFLVLFPFVLISLACYGNLSYGLLSELPSEDPSVVGTKAVQGHYPAGATGPLTLLFENPDVNFSDSKGREAIEKLTADLLKNKEELGIADIRNMTKPFGIGAADEMEKARDLRGLAKLRAISRIKVIKNYYVSSEPELENHVTRMDLILEKDPFSHDSMMQLERVKKAVSKSLPANLRTDTKLYYIGATASISDLKSVTDQDQARIDILVLGSVFIILVILLRRPAISAYLILSVFFSYLVTLGVTFTVFWALDPHNFTGLDWKVPMFLFTILIAVGEDYNIYLITRIDEEQKTKDPVDGVISALKSTGGIISSCGIIMAGTFSSLMAGTLVGMQQLGFALAFGVLLDTFIIRPIIVPAYLIMLYRGYFGSWGKYLGAAQFLDTKPQPELDSSHAK
ncbi:Membrane transport protein mmpL8 [Gimesia maris]|jgi:RND superfamily putative drug exporter|uniref:MMPL family transporter n=1 Tax=Gimesia maris TaxID=122 RepID=UPI00118B9824|nr:MMPL family transporter [Gimesia maris]QDT77481.1 Membrane transport protein mmpL8 [Gimesia maris]QDU13118.1 Membrane transport protein mmpL8 [Gimesia maris]|tara:strand:+ start:72285 stop:74750 length:2466 start_codon:yes stop_codon:yes gene_type:complete